ncbi:MAG TPA: phosphatase PAP2 family protein [Candidatus Paceibacterota bacterium]|nr:phosphatase PAP2 family protein [Candidatus Paceibacterota bacterium]
MGPIEFMDFAVSNAVHQMHSPIASVVFKSASYAFEPAAIGVVFVGIFIVAHWYHKDRQLALFAAIVLAACGLAGFLKQVFLRTRPETANLDAFHSAFIPAFPSAHALVSFVMISVAALWLLHLIDATHQTSIKFKRIVIIVVATLLIVLVGVSRVYLGEHWPSDVLGGWIFGILLVLCTAPAMRKYSI